MPDDPKFLADCMLGKLARWLVILGYDAVFATEAQADDKRLQERALAEGRVFLTRDRRIPEVTGLRMLVLPEPGFAAQLKRVLKELGIKPDPERFFTRCTLCNAGLEKVAREEVLAEIPEKVRELDTAFFRCPACRRLYWSGSHVERTMSRLREAGILEG